MDCDCEYAPRYYFVSSFYDGTVRTVCTDMSRKIVAIDHRGIVPAFCVVGDKIASISRDRVMTWNVENGEDSCLVNVISTNKHIGKMMPIGLSNKLVMLQNNNIVILDVVSNIVKTLTSKVAVPEQLGIFTTCNRVAISLCYLVILYDTNGKSIKIIEKKMFSRIVLSDTMLVISEKESIRVYDIYGKLLKTFPGYKNWYTPLLILNNKMISVCDIMINIIDLEAEDIVTITNDAPISCSAIVGNRIVIGSYDNAIRVLSEEGEILTMIKFASAPLFISEIPGIDPKIVYNLCDKIVGVSDLEGKEICGMKEPEECISTLYVIENKSRIELGYLIKDTTLFPTPLTKLVLSYF